jgi:hypothetical protein
MAARMHGLLKEIAAGGALETMAPKLRAGVTPSGRKSMAHRLSQIETFTFLACEDNHRPLVNAPE